MRRLVTNADRLRMRELYAAGLSLEQIASTIGWAPTTVSLHLKGVPKRRRLRSFRIGAGGYAMWGHSRVHRIVAEAWYGPIPEGYHVHHKNGDKLDNRPENLEIVTNHEHGTTHGVELFGRWDARKDGALMECSARGVPAHEIARALGVSKCSVDNRRSRLRDRRVMPAHKTGRRFKHTDWGKTAAAICRRWMNTGTTSEEG